MLETSDKL